MGHDKQGRAPGRATLAEDRAGGPAPGKQTLAEPHALAPIDQLIALARERGGVALEGRLRAALESALGTSLDDVKLHASGDADVAARALDADAFAIGQDVFFAAGQHENPALIAHEVAHTVQQRGARDHGPHEVSAPGDRHEVEAERFAESFMAGDTVPISPVSPGTISRRAIARQAAGTPAPPAATPRPPAPGALTIQPAESLAALGASKTYRIPAAEDQARRDGRYVCTWTIDLDPAAPAPRDGRRRVIPGSFNQPWAALPWRWTVEGTHKVTCNVRWERNANPGIGQRDAPPPEVPPQRELAVQVRSLGALSSERFDQTATTDAYFEARLRDMVTEARGQGGPTVDDPHEMRERRERIAQQQRDSDKIERGRQVICRAQLTLRENAQTVPLALAIGPATGHPGKLVLIDFTGQQRRADYNLVDNSADAVEALRVRNSYPTGLVEIDIPAAPQLGIAAIHRTFETTGQSSMSEWASGLGLASAGALVVGGIAAVMTAPISVPLLIIAGLVGGAASAVSLAERLHDARPSSRGIVIDALGVASSLLGGGALLAGGRTVTLAGRTMRVVDLTGRLALAADVGSLVLVADEAIDEIRHAWADTSKSENERLQAIALIITRITANAGLVVVSGRQTLRSGEPHARPGEPHGRPGEPHGQPRSEPHAPTEDAPSPTGAPRVAAPAAGARFSTEQIPIRIEAAGLSRRTGGALSAEQIGREGVSAQQLYDHFPNGLTLYRGMRAARDPATNRLLLHRTRPTEIGGERLQEGILNFSSERAVAEHFAERPGGNNFRGDVRVVLETRPITRDEALRFLHEGNFDPRIFENGLSTLDKWDMRVTTRLPDVVTEIRVLDPRGSYRVARPDEIEWR